MANDLTNDIWNSSGEQDKKIRNDNKPMVPYIIITMGSVTM